MYFASFSKVNDFGDLAGIKPAGPVPSAQGRPVFAGRGHLKGTSRPTILRRNLFQLNVSFDFDLWLSRTSLYDPLRQNSATRFAENTPSFYAPLTGR